MRNENAALDEELGRWMDENETLRTQVGRLEAGQPPSGGGFGGGGGGGFGGPPAPAEAEGRPSELRELRTKLKEATAKLKTAKAERDRMEADKVAIFGEMNGAVQKLEGELRAERAKAAKAEKMHARTREDLALANAEVLRMRSRLEAA